MDDAHAFFHRFEQIERRQAVVAVGVKLERRSADVLLDQPDQSARALRRQHAADVFEADPVRMQRRRVARFLRVILVGMARRDRVDQVHHRFHAELAQLLRLFAERCEIVPRVRSPRQRDAVIDDGLDHQPANAVGDKFEAAVQAAVVAQTGFLDFLGAEPEPVPGIFLVLAHELFEAQAQKKLHGVEARFVHMAQSRQHHARGHAVSPQADIAVAQSGIDDANLFHKMNQFDAGLLIIAAASEIPMSYANGGLARRRNFSLSTSMPCPAVIGGCAVPRDTWMGLKISCSPRRMNPVISPPGWAFFKAQ